MVTEAILDQVARTIKYVSPVAHSTGEDLTRQVNQQMREDFMAIPLLTLHSPAPSVMAGVWSILRETLLAGNVDRAVKEAVAAAVSKHNECPYCVESHTVMLHASADHGVAGAIMRGEHESIRDQRLREAVRWALPRQTADAARYTAPPFPVEQIPEIVGTAVTFHYLNRMANVFLGDTILPVPSVLKGVTFHLYAATAGKKFVRRLPPGRSLRLIPEASPPVDFGWVSGNPVVGGAFAGFVEVVEKAGRAALSPRVRERVNTILFYWDGNPKGISRRWVEESIDDLGDADRVAARLALLVAVASYQIDEGIVRNFQAQHPGDAALIGAAAWASLAAARRASEWLIAPVAEQGDK